MLPMLLPALIGAAGSIGAGIIGNMGKEKEIANQKQFAKEGIRWRVEDARAAGIHPALAMGANVPSYTPVGLGSDGAEAVSSMGQDISRAVSATMTLPEKADAFAQTSQRLQLENMSLQNDLLRAEILGLTRPSSPPFPLSDGGYPIAGQPASGSIRTPVFGGDMKVTTPGAAQTAEDNYGEPFGWLYGLGAFLEDVARSAPGSAKAAGDVYRTLPVRGSHLYK